MNFWIMCGSSSHAVCFKSAKWLKKFVFLRNLEKLKLIKKNILRRSFEFYSVFTNEKYKPIW